MDRAPTGPKTDRGHLIKDNFYCPKTFKMAKGKIEGGATGSWTQGLWPHPLGSPCCDIAHILSNSQHTHTAVITYIYDSCQHVALISPQLLVEILRSPLKLWALEAEQV